jgi:hypothetical protein
MAREVFKRSVIFLIFALIFSGCAEQAKESSPPATGLPVRVGLQNENGLPVEVRVKNESAGGGPVSLNMPADKKFSVEIDTKEKQVIPVKVEGWDSLEKFMKAFVADINTLSIKLNIPEGSQLPPLQVSLPSISSRVLMTITISVLAVIVAVFGALLAAFFAWRTSLNMKKIEKKIRSINLDK